MLHLGAPCRKGGTSWAMRRRLSRSTTPCGTLSRRCAPCVWEAPTARPPCCWPPVKRCLVRSLPVHWCAPASSAALLLYSCHPSLPGTSRCNSPTIFRVFRLCMRLSRSDTWQCARHFVPMPCMSVLHARGIGVVRWGPGFALCQEVCNCKRLRLVFCLQSQKEGQRQFCGTFGHYPQLQLPDCRPYDNMYLPARPYFSSLCAGQAGSAAQRHHYDPAADPALLPDAGIRHRHLPQRNQEDKCTPGAQLPLLFPPPRCLSPWLSSCVAKGRRCFASIDHRARSIITTALFKVRAGTTARPVCSCE